MPPEPNSTTPMPYQPGKSLELQVLQNWYSPPLPDSVTAVISKIYGHTMSSVMEVHICTQSGPGIHAVLKLYDRRFGTCLRQVDGKHAPHTAAGEETFRSFLRQGDADTFLRDFKEEKTTALIPPTASQFHDGTSEGVAKYEAALWQECCDYFDCETKAYENLRAIQGISIPRMYAHVCLAPSNANAASLDPGSTHYLDVKGILLEPVLESAMWDLAVSPLSSVDQKKWQLLVQSAVDAAHDINQRGILLEDCGPRNVVVEERSWKPFIIDLAQCHFKENLIAIWEKMRDEGGEDEDEAEEEEEWDLEAEYWERARSCDNPGAIGSVMATILLKEKGITLDIKYPNKEQ